MGVQKIIQFFLVTLAVGMIVIRPFVLYDIGLQLFDGDFTKVNNSLQRLVKKQDSFYSISEEMEEAKPEPLAILPLPVRILIRELYSLFAILPFLHLLRLCHNTVFQICPDNSQHQRLSRFQI